MRFLLDENLSPLLVELLRSAGHEVAHVRTLGLRSATDVEVMAAAVADNRVLISGDTDFGELLARTKADRPSVLLLRRQSQRRARELVALIDANLPAFAEDLEAGAVVVLDDHRVRVRALPLR